MQEVFENIIEKLRNELKLADEEKLRCARENALQFDSAKGYANGVGNAIKIVKQEAEQYNNGWIPCSERLPEPIRPVLVTLRNRMNDKCFVRVRRFHTDHWNTDEGIVENSVVIAWKPFPQPYEPKVEREAR